MTTVALASSGDRVRLADNGLRPEGLLLEQRGRLYG